MLKIKEGFRNERIVSLPESVLHSYESDPQIAPLYLRKMGVFPKVRFHYMEKGADCDYSMLIYCVDGKGWYRFNGITHPVKKGEFLILPAHHPYSFGADEQNPWTIYWFHFRGSLSHVFIPSEVKAKPVSFSRNQNRLLLFEEIYSSFSMGYIQEYMAYSSLSLPLLLASFLFPNQYGHSPVENAEKNQFSARVISYMQEHIEGSLTLEELAMAFDYSPSHFSTLFHKESGYSPINYFLRMKIQKACEYMELTNWKLHKISEKLGFDEPAYFSRTFTKVMGVSPSQYRKKESGYNPTKS